MRAALLSAAVAFALLVAGCTDSGTGGSGGDGAAGAPLERTVAISGEGYRPARVKILVGGSVTWINRDPDGLHAAETLNASLPGQVGDQVQHEEDYSFDTFTLTWGEPYTIEFHQPGRFEYYCPFDAKMEGQVEVVVRQPPKAAR